jgi:hypothetical protein
LCADRPGAFRGQARLGGLSTRAAPRVWNPGCPGAWR